MTAARFKTETLEKSGFIPSRLTIVNGREVCRTGTVNISYYWGRIQAWLKVMCGRDLCHFTLKLMVLVIKLKTWQPEASHVFIILGRHCQATVQQTEQLMWVQPHLPLSILYCLFSFSFGINLILIWTLNDFGIKPDATKGTSEPVTCCRKGGCSTFSYVYQCIWYKTSITMQLVWLQKEADCFPVALGHIEAF